MPGKAIPTMEANGRTPATATITVAPVNDDPVAIDVLANGTEDDTSIAITLAGAAINITLFSYAGTVHLGINSDRAAVVDHDLFTRCVREAIDATLTLTAPA